MSPSIAWRALIAFFVSLTCALEVAAQTAASPTLSTPPITNSTTRTPTVTTSSSTTSSAPDVYLNVPTLSVGRIELDVENLSADINLNANVAQLVTINAGVQVGITKVNLTIVDVDAQLELIVRLGHLVDIVERVFQSLDLNPLLLDVLNNATSDVSNLLDDVVGEVDGLLGSITQGGTTLSFVVDNLGNVVQQVNGVSTIVGDYLLNMTYTGTSQSLGSGLTQRTYSYSPLSALVNIVFNTAGQIVQATVQKATGSSSSRTASAAGSTSTST
ncbi:hypothetical protein LTR85_001662 [Meristemomyces frigidus]|nr:hypothetical protein LTR85_001662 [Meristemomyces frigidus]